MVQELGRIISALAIIALLIVTLVNLGRARHWGAIAKTAVDPEKSGALAKESQYDQNWMACGIAAVIIGLVCPPW